MSNAQKVNWSIHEWDSSITIREGKHMVCRCSKNVRGKKYATFIKTAPEMYRALKDCAGALEEVLEKIINGEKFNTVASDCLLAAAEDDLSNAKDVLEKTGVEDE